MARLVRTPTTPDWRNAEHYAYTAGLTPEGWAWEFLRRNSAYRADAARSRSPTGHGSRRPPGIELLALTEAAAEAERWGLMFL